MYLFMCYNCFCYCLVVVWELLLVFCVVKGLDCLSPGPGGFLGYKQTSGALDKRITPDGISYNHKAAPTPDTFHILDESADFF